MIEVDFFLAVEPFSINRMFCRDMRYKTGDYRDWADRVQSAMSTQQVQAALKTVREAFNPDAFDFHVQFTAHYPQFLTKAGQISNKTEDLSNIEKPLLDLLFLPKNHGNPVSNVNADDRFVTRLVSEKQHGSRSGIEVRIRLVPRQKPGPVS